MLALIAGTIIILQTASYYLVAIICVVLLLNREHYSFSLSFHGVGTGLIHPSSVYLDGRVE